MEKEIKIEELLEPGYETVTLSNGETLISDGVISLQSLYGHWA